MLGAVRHLGAKIWEEMWEKWNIQIFGTLFVQGFLAE